jgi:integrase
MRGHIRQRSKGSWSIVIDVGRDAETGKRRQQWYTVKGTKKDAERELREKLRILEAGAYVKPQRTSLAEYLKHWVESYAVMHTSPRTAEGYQAIVGRYLVPALGAIPLCELQPRHLEKYYANALSHGRLDGKGGLSPRTVLHQHRLLSEALSHAVKQGLLVRNVAGAVIAPRPGRSQMATLSGADVPRFLEAARKTPYYVLFYAALYTGMRRGELLGLRWCDIDLGKASISVVQTLYRLSNGEFVIKEPKSPHSRRLVALSPSLTELLRRHHTEQETQKILLGKAFAGHDLVFAHPDGSPLDPSTVTHAFGKLIKKAELPHIRFHDLRHTHATLMLKGGVHPKIVSERLGHANIGITLDTYSHVVPGLQEAAALRFDALISSEAEQTEDVSKMLAKDGDSDSAPRGIRTHDPRFRRPVLLSAEL